MPPMRSRSLVPGEPFAPVAVLRPRMNRPVGGTEYAVDMVRRQLIERFGAARVFGGGLRVTTTLDLERQRQAYDALFTQVLDRKSDPDAGMVVLDHDGRVLAMVGGRSWSVSQVNLAVGRGYGGLGRQGGSTFKPFVLAAAVREGISPATTFDAPADITIEGAGENGTDWKVSNYDEESFDAPITLTRATALSVNTVYAHLVSDPRVGAQRVAQMVKDLGVTSPLEPFPAIALGAEEVGPLEMADAYLTFAREGERVDPSLIEEVADVTGQVLYRSVPNARRVLTQEQAAVVNGVLQGVVADGTGSGAQPSDGRALAGKTGTTQNARDAWFVGYTPKTCCVVAVWMGFADTNRPMTNVRGRRVSGGSLPTEVFHRFMESAVVQGRIDSGEFRPPEDDVDVLTTDPPRRRRQSTPVATDPPDTAVAVDQPPVTDVLVDPAAPVDDGSTSGDPGGDTGGVADTVPPASAPVPVPVPVDAPPPTVTEQQPAGTSAG